MAKNIADRIKEGRQFRRMELRIKESAGVENASDSYVVEGYATTFGEEYMLYETEDYRVFEKVAPDAFSGCDMEDVIFQYDHEGRVYARLSNGTLKLDADGHGLKVTADLGGTEEGRKLFEEIKGGYTNKMSFGFTISGETQERRKGEDGKTEYLFEIKRISKLYDVSAVSIPANDGTEISARSHFDGAIEKACKVEAERLSEEQREKRQKEAERLALELSFKL
jgi:hypothetical protein